MTVEVVPFEAGLGAEIRDVDIREPLSPSNATRFAPLGLSIWYCGFANSR